MTFSKHFVIQEFVPAEIHHVYGERSIQFVRKEIVELADFTRDFLGKPMVINNWHLQGKFNYRGFRPRSYTGGGELSQHRMKSAFDFHVPGMDMREVYKLILADEKLFMEMGLTTMEDIDFTDPIGNTGTGWIHMDDRWTDKNFIVIVKPSHI